MICQFDWNCSSLSGLGTLYYNTSMVFIGQFVRNQLSGIGLQLLDGHPLFEGRFKDSLLSGKGQSLKL